ncbi:MAG: hypothetical protein Q8L79_07625 [Methylobacter sp.]|uniref:hypothetical protein n=1 Tax=Methylobacter sp. TaxID=2051955 RepID=UPI00272FC5BF|nr:hypothetical protein [Methylobacter sp.]MDP1664982.1 hypothetical protein [Methylobacter sp.]
MNPIILALVSCYGLSHDQQAYCQARQHNDVGYCYSITDQTLRQTCRSEIHQMPSNCDGISSDEARQLCRNKSAR